jgi:hypothetical protein
MMHNASTGTTLSAYTQGIGLLGPGLSNWSAGRAVLSGEQAYQPQTTVLPAPAILPAAERRRCGAIVKLTLATGLEAIAAAGLDAATLPTVFAASGGDGDTCHAICETLATAERHISPTRFHNSVHNAAAGYWSIATHAMAASAVLCAYDASFCAGLLEAVTQVTVDDTCTVLLACDTPYPQPLHGARPLSDAFGIALVLAPQPGAKALAKITISLTNAAADRLDDAALENLRVTIPAARGLPLLRALARMHEKPVEPVEPVVLDYLGNTRVAVAITQC